MRLYYSIFLLGCLLCPAALLHAQGKYLPTGLRIGADVMSIGKTLVNNGARQFEINTDIDFNNYLLNLDLGTLESQISGQNYAVNTMGNYYKVGVDINFMNKVPGHNAIFFGFRFAQSAFSTETRRAIDDDIFGMDEVSIKENMTSYWLEMGLGLKVNLIDQFYLGFAFRNRFLNFVSGNQSLQPYEVPGYGVAEASQLWRFNYYIFYRIPFRK